MKHIKRKCHGGSFGGRGEETEIQELANSIWCSMTYAELYFGVVNPVRVDEVECDMVVLRGCGTMLVGRAGARLTPMAEWNSEATLAKE